MWIGWVSSMVEPGKMALPLIERGVWRGRHEILLKKLYDHTELDIIMGKIIIFAMALPVLSSAAHAADLTRIAPLRNHKEIASAIEINNRINKLTERITSCVKKGKSHEKCLCENKKKTEELRVLIRSTLIKYPIWLDKGWFSIRDSNGKIVYINSRGLQKQARMRLQCRPTN